MRNLLLMFGLLALVGCANFIDSTRKAEFAAAQLADGSMKGYAAYWKTATNSATGAALTGLWNERSNVVAIARRVGAAEATLDTAITIYQTNSVTKPVVQSALAALIGSAGELQSTVDLFTGKSKPLFNPLP